MEKVEVRCCLCGKLFLRLKNQVHEYNFCCVEHSRLWNSQHMSEYNRTVNPMNKPGGVLDARIKRSNTLRGSGQGKAYIKLLGRHAHRAIAERLIGRPLKPGEVVHHIDGNKLNNDPLNLEVLSSQAEHARTHFIKKKAGDTNEHFR